MLVRSIWIGSGSLISSVPAAAAVAVSFVAGADGFSSGFGFAVSFFVLAWSSYSLRISNSAFVRLKRSKAAWVRNMP